MSRIINEQINGKFSQSGFLKRKKSVPIVTRRDRDHSEGNQRPVNPVISLIRLSKLEAHRGNREVFKVYENGIIDLPVNGLSPSCT
jgi:hypothetical protein